MPPIDASARKLVLELLSANAAPLPVRNLIRGAAVLGVGENSLRVTLARLKAAELVQLSKRGEYELGPAALAVQEEVRGWKSRARDADLRPWTPADPWLGVHIGGLPRVGRVDQRRRDRALRLLGLRPLSAALFVRPDNLVGGRSRLQAQLAQLGLPAQAQVVGLTGLEPEATLALWDTAALDAEYAALRSQLQRSAAQLHRLPLAEAARESFEVGARAIRALVLDPLLPAPLVDVEGRRALAREMERYDELGHALWRRLMFEDPPANDADDPSAGSVAPHDHEHEPLLQTGMTALLDLTR